MFQYALGRHLSLKYDVPLRFSTYFYRQNDHRTPTLFEHDVAGEPVSDEELAATLEYPSVSKWMQEGKELVPTPPGGINANLYYVPRFFPEFTAETFNYYREKLESDRLATCDWAYRRQFNPKILNCGEDAYLHGYWQSYRYFEEYADVIRDDLTVSEPLTEPNKRYESMIEQRSSVALHVRRGDKTEGSSRALPVEYYRDAVEHVSSHADDPTFFVFSDDIEWARANLELDHRCEFVAANDETTDYFDVHLMKRCDHNIIANSTFSWWGAYLNENEDRVVTVPDPWPGKKWPNRSIHDTDMIPRDWTFVEYDERTG